MACPSRECNPLIQTTHTGQMQKPWIKPRTSTGQALIGTSAFTIYTTHKPQIWAASHLRLFFSDKQKDD
ncbi:hypothetical protein Sjap_013443 [Stephania japonica]|uniref:Uncharacterized protein n=1 Tax=Stephania japonica TaxID=461633 RepID=A0AAP0J0E1_9MAGN